MSALTREHRDRVWQVSLAALLHDVGKLAQRAEADPERFRSLSNLQEFAVTDEDARTQYHHAAYTWQFIESHFSWLKLCGEGADDNIAGWASRHHKPSSPLDWIVAESDRLAAGMDRGHDDESLRGWQHVQTLRLTPLLSRIHDSTQAGNWEMPMRPLAAGTTASPQRSISRSQQDGAAEYRTLFDEFCRVARDLSGGDVPRFFQSFLTVYERFAWAVPAATNITPCDVSLFEHSRAASAIAAALTAQFLATDEPLVEASVRDRVTPRYSVAVGDLSGIQRFIYTIVTKNAARALRGRSFALQLLADGIGAFLLRRIGMPPANVLYSGGGKLWLLVPAFAGAALRDEAERIDLALQEEYGGRLGFALGLAPLTGDDFIQKKIAERWADATADLHRQRQRRLARSAHQRYAAVFGPFGEPGEDTLCHVCGTLAPKIHLRKCAECEQFERLGTLLTRARCIVRVCGEGWRPRVERWRQELPEDSSNWYWPLPDVLAGAYLVSTNESRTLLGTAEAADVVLSLNDLEISPAGTAAVGYLLAGVNRLQREEGVPLTFDDMAAASDGIDRLGVLRMDVDNLGDIFTTGLPENERTISRITNLSKALAYFFGGIVSALVEQEDAPWSNQAQIIYSGGDDAFIVGSWSALPSLARAIRRAFRDFTAHNRAWGISAGITVVRAQHPIASAAKEAGELEHAAKDYPPRANGRTKDAIAFLGDVVGWDDFEVVGALASELIALIDTRLEAVPGFEAPPPAAARLSRGWLHRLGRIVDLHRRGVDDLRPQQRSITLAEIEAATRRGRWRWNKAYALARATANRELGLRLEVLMNALPQRTWPSNGGQLSAERDLIWLLGPAVLWADYLSRERRT